MSSLMDEFCRGQFWDGNLTFSNTAPYFTHCFEETVILCIPLGIFIVFVIYDVMTHSGRKSEDRITSRFPLCYLQYFKGFLISCLILEVISPHILDMENGKFSFNAIDRLELFSFFSRISGYVIALIVLIVSYGCRQQFYNSEVAFWITLLISEGILFRTAVQKPESWTNNDEGKVTRNPAYNIRMVLFPTTLITSVTHALDWMIRYRQRTSGASKSFCSKTKLSIFNVWMEKLFWKTFKDENYEEFFENIHINPKHISTQTTTDATIPSSQRNVIYMFCTRFGKRFLMCGLQRLLQELLGFATPEILRRFVEYLSESADSSTWKDHFFVGSLIFVILLRNLVGLIYWKNITAISLKFRSLLHTSVISKSFQLGPAASQGTKSEMLNILSADSQKINDLIPQLHTLWVAPLQLVLATYLLHNLFGNSGFAAGSLLLCLIIFSIVLANRIRQLQLKQMLAKDRRIKFLAETVNSLKVIKLQGLSEAFTRRINEARVPELKAIQQCLFTLSFLVCGFTVAPVLVLVVTLLVFLWTGDGNLTAVKVFTALSIINIVTVPLLSIPALATLVAQSIVSIRRINEHLNFYSRGSEVCQSGNDCENAIVFDKVWVSWQDKPSLLKNLNVKIPKGSLVVITGDSESGKSSFLRTILGETNILSGSVSLNGTVAFSPEIPWLRNGTIKENILFFRDFQSELYSNVVNSCHLSGDLDYLPMGDETLVEDNAVNLSGGQKQRVSLARAAYSSSSICLFDNPLSALDSRTAKDVYSKLLGPGGILKSSTRLIVTSLPDHQILDDADLIFHVGESTVFERKKSSLKSLNMKQNQTRVATETSFRSVQSPDNYSVEMGSKSGILSSKPNLKYYAAHGGFVTIIFGFVFIIGSTGAYTLSNIWLSKWTSLNETQQMGFLTRGLLTYGLCGLAQAAFLIIGCYFIFKFSIKASRNLHNVTVNNVVNAKISNSNAIGISPILNILSRDMEIIDSNLPLTVQGVMLNLFLLCSGIFTICYSMPIFLTFAIPIALVYVIIQRFYVSKAIILRRLESSTRTKMYSNVFEALAGISVIKAFQTENITMEEIQDKLNRNNKAHFLCTAGSLWIKARLDIFGMLILLGVSVFVVCTKQELETSITALALSSALQITQLLNYFVKLTCDFESNLVAVERIETLADIPQECSRLEQVNVADFLKNSSTSNWPETGIISMRDVEVYYPNVSSPVLHIPNWILEDNQKVGIIGKTGAGKSTLLLVLFRLLELTRGVVRISGVDISLIPVSILRSKIAIVPQEPVFYADTIRFNIDPSNKYTDNEIWNALEVVLLKKYISRFPLGLSYVLNAECNEISAGTKQLIYLARAVLKKCKILVMDEATSNCDKETELIFGKVLKEHFKHATILIIAHRLQTVKECDWIATFQNGKIFELDTPENLRNSESSYFYKALHCS